eukprot:scaffold12918_cov98-Isochrysis_galbana.AAC.3
MGRSSVKRKAARPGGTKAVSGWLPTHRRSTHPITSPGWRWPSISAAPPGTRDVTRPWDAKVTPSPPSRRTGTSNRRKMPSAASSPSAPLNSSSIAGACRTTQRSYACTSGLSRLTSPLVPAGGERRAGGETGGCEPSHALPARRQPRPCACAGRSAAAHRPVARRRQPPLSRQGRSGRRGDPARRPACPR